MQNKKDSLSLALGFFDGVHAGHQIVIKEAIKHEKDGIISAVYTFSKSPKDILGEKDYFYLTTNTEKIKLLLNYGINKIYVDNFENVKDLSCEEFVSEIIGKKLNARYVVCGENYRFGRNGEGDAKKLKKICEKYKIETKIVPLKTYENLPISSSRIKKLIESGKLEDIPKMLGGTALCVNVKKLDMKNEFY